jgi:hypothetical protein
MKIILVRPTGKRLPCRLPFEGADRVVLATDCPECGEHEPRIQGAGKRPSEDDKAWEADAVTACCNRYVGTLRVETGTFFGVREDARIAQLGIRIY